MTFETISSSNFLFVHSTNIYWTIFSVVLDTSDTSGKKYPQIHFYEFYQHNLCIDLFLENDRGVLKLRHEPKEKFLFVERNNIKLY